MHALQHIGADRHTTFPKDEMLLKLNSLVNVLCRNHEIVALAVVDDGLLITANPAQMVSDKVKGLEPKGARRAQKNQIHIPGDALTDPQGPPFHPGFRVLTFQNLIGNIFGLIKYIARHCNQQEAIKEAYFEITDDTIPNPESSDEPEWDTGLATLLLCDTESLGIAHPCLQAIAHKMMDKMDETITKKDDTITTKDASISLYTKEMAVEFHKLMKTTVGRYYQCVHQCANTQTECAKSETGSNIEALMDCVRSLHITALALYAIVHTTAARHYAAAIGAAVGHKLIVHGHYQNAEEDDLSLDEAETQGLPEIPLYQCFWEWLLLLTASAGDFVRVHKATGTFPTKILLMMMKQAVPKLLPWDDLVVQILEGAPGDECMDFTQVEQYHQLVRLLYPRLFSGTVHAEAYLAALLKLNESRTASEIHIGVSKCCCLFCASFVDAMNKSTGLTFMLQDEHKRITGCAVPPFSEDEVVQAMISEYRPLLRTRILARLTSEWRKEENQVLQEVQENQVLQEKQEKRAYPSLSVDSQRQSSEALVGEAVGTYLMIVVGKRLDQGPTVCERLEQWATKLPVT
ncbi:uncharacterized protein B0H18DRAFT_960043 [Fomitopsis serialis]|uniref:uncharacterized protein n=1 Tax=Fomitopsis serialis TaxID=139415 RepID=UPI002007834C|nr:uncharacterized protein B0H18DRAFT_960043 [Neoantrodia serialis]KAH9914038.1 hypothetical protein B0H18DRAFT_960043 [Neoantrodia serialis]